jgi:hypothetical protein
MLRMKLIAKLQRPLRCISSLRYFCCLINLKKTEASALS